MSVDVFGRQLIRSKEVLRGPPGIGFSLTTESNFDIQNKRLCNIGTAVDSTDAVNLAKLESSLEDLDKKIHKAIHRLERKFDNFKTSWEKDRLTIEEFQRVSSNKT